MVMTGVATINFDVPDGSLLGPFLLLLYIKNLNHVIKFFKVHYFADDTNQLGMSNSIKTLNKLINTAMVSCSRFISITNSSDQKRD